MEIVGISFLSAVGLFILMWKINLELFARYHWQTQKRAPSMLLLLCYGRFSGMVTALVADIVISNIIFISRLIIKPI